MLPRGGAGQMRYPDPHAARSARGNAMKRLGSELLEMAAEDRRMAEELSPEGSLFEGYHPRMEAIHRRNAARLAAILEEQGWPGASLVGDEAAEAAWLIAQHAIGEPDFQ